MISDEKSAAGTLKDTLDMRSPFSLIAFKILSRSSDTLTFLLVYLLQFILLEIRLSFLDA